MLIPLAGDHTLSSSGPHPSEGVLWLDPKGQRCPLQLLITLDGSSSSLLFPQVNESCGGCSPSPSSPSSSAGTSVLLVQGEVTSPLWVTADLSVPSMHTRIPLGPSQSPKSPLCTFESFVFFNFEF